MGRRGDSAGTGATLTRGQVAKRIGKSIATVRRLEGVRLHPVVDSDGVHRFDVAEVERLAVEFRGDAATSAADGAGRSAWFKERTEAGQCDEVAELRQRLADLEQQRRVERERLEAEVAEARLARVAALEELRGRERDNREAKVARRLEEERYERTQAREKELARDAALALLGELESLSDRQLRRLIADEPRLIEAMEAAVSELDAWR